MHFQPFWPNSSSHANLEFTLPVVSCYSYVFCKMKQEILLHHMGIINIDGYCYTTLCLIHPLHHIVLVDWFIISLVMLLPFATLQPFVTLPPFAMLQPSGTKIYIKSHRHETLLPFVMLPPFAMFLPFATLPLFVMLISLFFTQHACPTA